MEYSTGQTQKVNLGRILAGFDQSETLVGIFDRLEGRVFNTAWAVEYVPLSLYGSFRRLPADKSIGVHLKLFLRVAPKKSLISPLYPTL